MTEKSRTAKFFCENCGAEVARNAKLCRHCGRFFSSVRCPQCGKTGTPEEFSKGCPDCGYTVESSPKDERRLSKKEKKAPTSHNVKSGENLSTIAKKYGTTVSALKKANGLKGDELHPGDKLKLPSKGKSTSKKSSKSKSKKKKKK